MVLNSILCINYSLAGTYKFSIQLIQSRCELDKGNKSILFYSMLFVSFLCWTKKKDICTRTVPFYCIVDLKNMLRCPPLRVLAVFLSK